ncbi:LOW QUALITY PROTEIN: putative splicing factor YJU2B [Balearica regulorum gibbericeps]|uniref:LOW QUALITY PROTEIN: putative splicing factor YJU2B n=1 Tax=Balearica regulorum gibbericeps TaxID=100784 RepID=UPI003F601BC3
MPYNIWCDGCKNHIGMGVRYNAEKKKVGTYYTTPIYRFRRKCHLCVNYIEMQTDPAGCDYVIVSGARRKEERWDMRDNEQVLPTGDWEEKEKLETDAMFRLEHGVADRGDAAASRPTLASLQEAQNAWKDDFALNSRLRRRFREEKKTLREEEEEAAALQAKAGLSIPLVREAEEDRRLAALLKYHSPDSYEEKQRMKRTEISSRSWFPPAVGGGRAGEALRKLGLGGRALWGRGGTPATPTGLGIVRRRSGEGPEGPAEPGGPEQGETAPHSPPAAPSEPQGGGDPGTAPHADPPAPLAASLVADYSDSSSEAESA